MISILASTILAQIFLLLTFFFAVVNLFLIRLELISIYDFRLAI